MSWGQVLGAIGNDTASSAQSKHGPTAFENVGRGKAGCSQLSWGGLGGWGVDRMQGANRECSRVQTVSLVTQAGCGIPTVAKQLGCRGFVWQAEWLGCISGVFWWSRYVCHFS